MRLPPPLTHVLSAETCPAVKVVWPMITTSNVLRTLADSSEASSVVNESRPSLRRISPMYAPNGLLAADTTRTCGGDASVENVHDTSAASGLPARSVTASAPPLIVTRYVTPYASALCGVTVATLVGLS